MSVNEVVVPYPLIVDTDGTPLDNGYIYIGTAGSDAETNPITVYWDSGKAVTASVPIRTSAGYIANNGTPAKIFADADDYSITIKDSAGAVVYTALNTDNAIPISDVTGTLASSAISFIRSETGAVSRTLQAKGRDIISVKDFGAVGDGVTDDTTAIQAAIDAIDTAHLTKTGGVLYFPMGTYVISATLNMRNTEATEHLASITLRGDGMQNTTLDCASGFTGTDALYMQHSTYCVIEDMGIDGNDQVTNCLHIENGSEIRLQRVFCQYATTACFLVDQSFLITMDQCRAKTPNGARGFDFSGGYNTSLVISNCYCASTAATGTGFRIDDVAYSSFIGCACDSAGYYAYEINNTSGVALIGCGAEDAGRASFYVKSSAALDAASTIKGTQCSLIDCFSHGADDDGGSYGSIYSNQVDTGNIDVIVERFQEFSNDGSFSVVGTGVELDHKLTLRDCILLDTISGVGIVGNETNILRFSKSVTAATAICTLSSLAGHTNMYSGLIHIIATLDSYHSSSGSNLASYVYLITKTTVYNQVLIASEGLKTGAAASWPSFTFTVNASNQLIATPVGSTSGTFHFYITQIGGMKISTV